MYPPQSKSKGPRFGKLCEIHRPYFVLDPEKWKPQILQQITQNLLNSPNIRANHAELVKIRNNFNYLLFAF